MTYTQPILLTGDQIAKLGKPPYNQGNPGDPNFGMVLPEVEALDGPEVTYRLVWYQNLDPNATQFANGQFWRLEIYKGTGDPATDPNNWQIANGFDNLVPKNDYVSGVGAGDDYIVFERGGTFLLYDLNGNLPQDKTTMVYLAKDQNGDPTVGDNDGELDFADARAAYQPICFCAGTLIETDRGPVPVEALRVGDRVVTLDRGPQPIRWIGHRQMSLLETLAFPAALPVCIAAGAMGDGLPRRDLMVSPQHRLLVRSKVAERMTGTAEALVAAKHLCGLPGIAQRTRPGRVAYYHLRLDAHHVVRAEGIWAETLLVGPMALQSLGASARQELASLFPGLVETVADAARQVLAGRQARKLTERHGRNGKALVMAG